ncbi:MAG: cell division protein FtsQ [Paludibacteraceae bacterium]|nr:cell division protein FtsQ [Paludibacteraceae bacterium]
MNKVWRYVLWGFAFVAVFAYLLCVWLLPDERKSLVCTDVVIVVKDSAEQSLLTSKMLRAWLTIEQVDVVGQPMKDIPTQVLEDALMRHPLTRTAVCYERLDGTIVAEVTARVPLFRVAGQNNYFVDTDRRIMPVRSTTATYVPVVTGYVSEQMATGELYDFFKFVSGNPFWNAQIVQVDVRQSGEVIIVPRVGGHTILLGELKDYKTKLKKMKIFYGEGFAKIGWKQYKEIDLRFENQIIGRK